MGKITLDTYELKEEIIAMLEREKHIVIATCSDGRVTARTMSHVNAGMDIFFQTDKRFLKIEQILKNPRVALCAGNLQIEGIAKLQGHPFDSENADFCSLYKQKHPHSFEMYAAMKDEIVIKVKPSLFTLWKYIDGKPCRDYLNLNENIAYREYYDMRDS
jgi:general stress protein 26